MALDLTPAPDQTAPSGPEDSRVAAPKGSAEQASRVRMPMVTTLLCLAYVALVFPPVNWPDERRNLSDLQAGGYGVVYGRVQDLVRWMADGFFHFGPFDVTALGVQENPGWAYTNGTIHYATSPGEASASYYLAKFTNILIIVAAALLFRWWAGRGGRSQQARQKSSLYVLSMLMPAVCYQLMQVSTDTTFILMSLSLYFIESKRMRLVFAAVSFLGVFEDRSFAILGVSAVGFALLPAAIPWHVVKSKPMLRFALIAVAAALASLAGSIIALHIQGDPRLIAITSTDQGLSHLSNQLQYTRAKHFTSLEGPILFYTGLIYLPSATEFLISTIPLYLVALPVFFRLGRITLKDTSVLGERFFYLVLAVIPTFFGLIATTHVFEHGRYYLTLAPVLAMTMSTFVAYPSGAYLENERALRAVRVVLVVLNIGLTTLIALPTLTSG